MVISIKSSFLLYYSNLISVISLCIFLTLYCYDISSRNQIYSHFIKLFITCFLTSILSSSFQYVFSHHYLTVAPLCAFFFFHLFKTPFTFSYLNFVTYWISFCIKNKKITYAFPAHITDSFNLQNSLAFKYSHIV